MNYSEEKELIRSNLMGYTSLFFGIIGVVFLHLWPLSIFSNDVVPAALRITGVVLGVAGLILGFMSALEDDCQKRIIISGIILCVMSILCNISPPDSLYSISFLRNFVSYYPQA